MSLVVTIPASSSLSHIEVTLKMFMDDIKLFHCLELQSDDKTLYQISTRHEFTLKESAVH